MKSLVYLVTVLIGYVIAECFWSTRRPQTVLLKIVAWIGILYFVIYGVLPVFNWRVWRMSLSFAILYTFAIAIGILARGVIQKISRTKGSGIESTLQQPASGIFVALVCAIATPILIIASDFGQFVYFVQESIDSMALIAPLFGVFAIACVLLALKLKEIWVAWVFGALPIFLYYDPWVAIPLLVGYVLGCSSGDKTATAHRQKSLYIILFVLLFIGTAYFDGYMRPYTLRGFGVFFPRDGGPALLGALMFPLLFLTGSLLTQLGETRVHQ